jgi:leucyl aminopeptidase (aminopeptidase T)
MTTHQRNFPSIGPTKLARLAETAVKVGLRLQPGQDPFLTAPVAALPLARRIGARGGAARRRPRRKVAARRNRLDALLPVNRRLQPKSRFQCLANRPFDAQRLNLGSPGRNKST